VLPFCIAGFVAAGAEEDWPAADGPFAGGTGLREALVAGVAAFVLSGGAADAGEAVFAALLGGSPVVAVREADRLGNGEKALKITV
jgi:hypothetical protein